MTVPDALAATAPPRAHGTAAGAHHERTALGRWLRRVRTAAERRPHLLLGYKVLVAGVGVVVILAGIAMLVLPGPGLLTMFVGLSILATEFAFAHRWVERIRAVAVALWHRALAVWQARRAARRG